MTIFTTGKRNLKRPSYRGKTQYDVVRGQPRVRGWPRKRPHKKTPQHIEQIEWFRQANWATKYWPAEFQTTIREALVGTPLYPRDVMLMLMSGRFGYLSLDDGRNLYPMAARIDVSESLDVLSSAPNSVLVRGPQFWTALTAPSPGLFLQSGVAGGPPQWNVAATSAIYSAVIANGPYQQPSPTYAKVENWSLDTETISMWDNANQQFVIPSGVNVVQIGFNFLIAQGTASACVGRINLNGAGKAWVLQRTSSQVWDTTLTRPLQVVAGDVIDFSINTIADRTIEGTDGQQAWVQVLG